MFAFIFLPSTFIALTLMISMLSSRSVRTSQHPNAPAALLLWPVTIAMLSLPSTVAADWLPVFVAADWLPVFVAAER